jgi:hypothetical protein
MKLSILAALAAAVALSGCATGADLKELNKTIKTLQDDKACDSHKEWDIGAGGGQLGGEAHAAFKGTQDCGPSHGSQALPKPLKAGDVIAPPVPPKAGATPP